MKLAVHDFGPEQAAALSRQRIATKRPDSQFGYNLLVIDVATSCKICHKQRPKNYFAVLFPLTLRSPARGEGVEDEVSLQSLLSGAAARRSVISVGQAATSRHRGE